MNIINIRCTKHISLFLTKNTSIHEIISLNIPFYFDMENKFSVIIKTTHICKYRKRSQSWGYCWLISKTWVMLVYPPRNTIIRSYVRKCGIYKGNQKNKQTLFDTLVKRYHIFETGMNSLGWKQWTPSLINYLLKLTVVPTPYNLSIYFSIEWVNLVHIL